MNTTHLFRRSEVERRYGKKRSSLYRDIRGGVFPPPVGLGRNCSVWPSNEVEAIIQARIAGKTDDEIRALVARLVAARRKSSVA